MLLINKHCLHHFPAVNPQIKNAAYRRTKHFLLIRESRLFLQRLECIPATKINSFRGQQSRGAEAESWSEEGANTGKMPKLRWNYWWHPDLTQQTEEEMLVKLSVKMSAVLEKGRAVAGKARYYQHFQSNGFCQGNTTATVRKGEHCSSWLIQSVKRRTKK